MNIIDFSQKEVIKKNRKSRITEYGPHLLLGKKSKAQDLHPSTQFFRDWSVSVLRLVLLLWEESSWKGTAHFPWVFTELTVGRDLKGTVTTFSESQTVSH